MATLVVFLGSTLVELVQSVTHVRVGQRITYQLASDVFAHLQRLSVLFHGRRPVGDTINRVNYDTFGLQALLMGVGLWRSVCLGRSSKTPFA